MKFDPNERVGGVLIREIVDGRVIIGGGIPFRLYAASQLVLSNSDHNYAYSRAGDGKTYEELLAETRLKQADALIAAYNNSQD